MLSPTEHRTDRRTLPKNGCAVHLNGLDLNCSTQRAIAETYRGATWMNRDLPQSRHLEQETTLAGAVSGVALPTAPNRATQVHSPWQTGRRRKHHPCRWAAGLTQGADPPWQTRRHEVPRIAGRPCGKLLPESSFAAPSGTIQTATPRQTAHLLATISSQLQIGNASKKHWTQKLDDSSLLPDRLLIAKVQST